MFELFDRIDQWDNLIIKSNLGRNIGEILDRLVDIHRKFRGKIGCEIVVCGKILCKRLIGIESTTNNLFPTVVSEY